MAQGNQSAGRSDVSRCASSLCVRRPDRASWAVLAPRATPPGRLSNNLVQEQKSELRDVRDIFLCKKEQLSGDKDASACRVQIKQGVAPVSE